jgi:NTE family protein
VAEKPVRGLVLSGGGGRGAYECGVYKGLHEHGIEPDILVGTSIGAINAAAIVAGASPEDLEHMWLAMDTKRVHKSRWDFWNFFRWRNLLDHSPWERTLLEHIDFNRIPQSPKKLRVTAVDVEAGELRVFSNQDITAKHILASCSIPVIYPWTQIDDVVYWDGGTMANTPLGPAIDAGADEIYVVLLSQIGARQLSVPRNILEGAGLAFELAILASFKMALKQLQYINALCEHGLDTGDHRIVQYHLIAPSKPLGLDLILRYERAQIRELIKLGYEDTKRVLEEAVE